MNNNSVYNNNKFNSTLSVFNSSSNINSSVYVASDKNRGKSRTSLNALSFYKASSSVYVKKVDKSDKKDNVKTLIRYLGWKNYSGSISPNLFKNPSMTDLINIWNFIFKHVDPLIEVNKDNYGEVVLSFYKDIGYPYTISKSTLVAPTTGLQYNTHLSALAWLCQLLIFEAECFNDINEEKEINFSEEIADDNEIKMDEFILHSYKSYINKEERNLNDLMNAKLDKEIDQLDESIKKRTIELSEKKSKIEEIKSHMKENDDLIKRNEVLCEENKKIRALHEHSLEETARLEKEIETCKMNNEEEKKKTEEILEELKKIKEILQKQTLNKAQFMEMNEDIEQNKEKIENLKKEISVLQNEYPSLSDKLSTKHIDLKKLAKTINEKFLEITENVNLYKNISHSRWDRVTPLTIKIDSFNVDDMLNANWKEKKHEIKTFIEQDEKELTNSLNLIEEYEKQIEIVQEEIEYLKEDIAHDEETVIKLNEETNQFINESKQHHQNIITENENMMNEANEKKNKANEMLEDMMKSKEEKQNEFEQLKLHRENIYKQKLQTLQKVSEDLLELKGYSKKFITCVLEQKKNTYESFKELQKSVLD